MHKDSQQYSEVKKKQTANGYTPVGWERQQKLGGTKSMGVGLAGGGWQKRRSLA